MPHHPHYERSVRYIRQKSTLFDEKQYQHCKATRNRLRVTSVIITKQQKHKQFISSPGSKPPTLTHCCRSLVSHASLWDQPHPTAAIGFPACVRASATSLSCQRFQRLGEISRHGSCLEHTAVISCMFIEKTKKKRTFLSRELAPQISINTQVTHSLLPTGSLTLLISKARGGMK